MKKSLVALVLSVASIALAGQAFFIEAFFDDVAPGKRTSFSFEQQGVTVTVMAKAGTLNVIDGVIYPSDPDTGLTVVTDIAMDQFGFYGPVLSDHPSCMRITRHPKSGELHQSPVPIIEADIGENTGAFNGVLNRTIGFIVIGAGIDALSFDEYGR